MRVKEAEADATKKAQKKSQGMRRTPNFKMPK